MSTSEAASIPENITATAIANGGKGPVDKLPSPPSWILRTDGPIERIGEWLNPIVVKECRQALKSRQFVITFALVLGCSWLWSLGGVAMLGPEVFYGSEGAEMFYGYYLILAFPLLVIVPYGAFRSLAGEREDRTFELLSITTLRPRQIVSGKLASAAIQMLVYLSAVSPCLAFTYLLRGIDVVTICFILTYLVAGSMAFSVGALLLATISRERHWQIVLSVALVLGLFFGFMGSCGLSMELLSYSQFTIYDPTFWQVHGAFATAYLTYFVMIFLAAAAQLTFASDNRSTALRVCAFVQQALFIGWFAFFIGKEINSGFWFFIVEGAALSFVVILLVNWYAQGILLTGESSELSPRVRRSLPKSFLGRTCLTLFNPGPGTGYLFALGNLTAGVIIALVAKEIIEIYQPSSSVMPIWGGPGMTGPGRAYQFSILTVAYLAFYLGLGIIVLRWCRRLTTTGTLTGVLIHALLMLVGIGGPLIVDSMLGWPFGGYNLLHVSNPIWTLMQSSTRRLDNFTAAIVVVAGAAMLLINARQIIAEVRNVRIARPVRVSEEDALLIEATAQKPAPTSPWDEGA